MEPDSSLETLRNTILAIESDWPDLLRQTCNPLDIATPMLPAEGRHEYDSFQQIKGKLQHDIQKAVNKHYMTFNDSVGAYGIVEETLNESQGKLGIIKQEIQDIKQITTTNTNLMMELNEKSQQYSQMIELVLKMKEINDLVVKLEDCVADRDFEKATSLVLQIKDIVNIWGLWKMESMKMIHSRMNSSISSLLEGIVDEINELIYAQNLTFGNVEDSNSHMISAIEGVQGFIKYLYGDKITESESLQMEIGKFTDLKKKMEVVKSLGNEAECLKLIVKRVDSEIKKTIQKSILEVKTKYPTQIELNNSTSKTTKHDFGHFGVIQGLNSTIVHECFDKIFKRALYLMQRHVALYHLSKVDGYDYNLGKVWDILQKRLSLVICNYIVDEEVLDDVVELTYTNKNSNKSPFTRTPKDLELIDAQSLFHFNSLNIGSANSKKDLIKALKYIFPNQSVETVKSDVDEINKSETGIYIGLEELSGSKGEVLVHPSIFNMGYIIDQFIFFQCSVSQVYPNDNSTNTIMQFFDQFMSIVFAPQLESTLMFEFDKLCESIWRSDSGHPYGGQKDLEVSQLFYGFFSKILSALGTSLYFREPYVDIIFKLLKRMHLKFVEIRDSLLQGTQSNILSAWELSKKLQNSSKEIINNMVESLNYPIESLANDPEFFKKLKSLQSQELETALSIAPLANIAGNIHPSAFLRPESLQILVRLVGSLSNILEWLPEFQRQLSPLRNTIDEVQKLKEIWSINVEKLSDTCYLVLDEPHLDQFNLLIKSLTDLQTTTLFHLRYQMRLECLYTLQTLSLSLESSVPMNRNAIPGVIPNKSIILDEEITSDVESFSDRVSIMNNIFNELECNEGLRIFIFGGIGYWIDNISIQSTIMIRKMIRGGWMKFLINLRVLQQVVRSVDFEDELALARGANILGRSIRWFGLGGEGEQVINKVTTGRINIEGYHFTKEEWSTLIRLVYDGRQEDKRKSYIDRVLKFQQDAQVETPKQIV